MPGLEPGIQAALFYPRMSALDARAKPERQR
jgi:hypothetical protein